MDSSGGSRSCNRVLVLPDQGGQGQCWTHQEGQGDVTEYLYVLTPDQGGHGQGWTHQEGQGVVIVYLYFLTRVDRDKDGLMREVKEL
jgi:hypothetical protein